MDSHRAVALARVVEQRESLQLDRSELHLPRLPVIELTAERMKGRVFCLKRRDGETDVGQRNFRVVESLGTVRGDERLKTRRRLLQAADDLSQIAISNRVRNGSCACTSNEEARPSRKNPPVGVPSSRKKPGVNDTYDNDGVLRNPGISISAPPKGTGSP
jgi:hypothetical protein